MNLVETLRSRRTAWAHPDAERRPGVVLSATVGDATAIDASGLAVPGHGLAMTTSTRLYAASLAKPVTALCVHRLAEAGRIDLDEPVQRWFPRLAPAGEITVRHLLLHRSGLPEYHALRLVAGAHVDDRLEHADVLRLVDGMSTWFDPGSRVAYTNTNYAMLAHVVADVTGTPFATAVADLVFRPAGMAGALVRETADFIVPGAAEGCVRQGDGFGRAVMGCASIGDGGMWWSGNDLAAFGRMLLGGGLPTETGSDSCVRRMRQQLALPDGTVPDLAHGCLVSRDGWFGALAEFTGFRAEVRVHPADGVAIAAMTNQQDAPIGALLDSVAASMGVAGGSAAEVPDPTPGPTPDGVLVGVGGAPWTFRASVDADAAVDVEVGTLRFALQADGAAWHVAGRPAMRVAWEGADLVVRDSGREVARLRSVGGRAAADDELVGLAGWWWCPSADAALHVERIAGGLVLRRGQSAPEPLVPVGERAGRWVLAAPWGLLELDRDGSAGVVVLHRAEGLPVHRLAAVADRHGPA